MKNIFLLLVIIASSPSFAAHGKHLIVKDLVVYQTTTEADWAEQINSEPALKAQQFLQLESKDGSVSFVGENPVSLPPFTYNGKPKKMGPLPKLEGCANHPMTWLQGSNLMATLKDSSQKQKIFIQVPKGAAVLKKYPDDLPAAYASYLSKAEGRDTAYTKEEVLPKLKEGRFLNYQDYLISYTMTDDGLNQSVVILYKPKVGKWGDTTHTITVTDECP